LKSTNQATRKVTVRHFLLAIAFAVTTVTVVLSESMAAPERGEVAIAFPPFTSEMAAWEIVRAAGGSLVSPTRLPNVVVAFAPDKGFQERAQALGALLFLTQLAFVPL
jgi:hypothetical protein